MTAAPSMAQIRAQVAEVRGRYPQARVIAVQSAAAGETSALHVGSEELTVFHADSVLALRERLAALPGDGPPLVVLTGLTPAELGSDLLARLAGGRLFPMNPWQLVKARFAARHVDPRLTRHGDWVPQALLDTETDGGQARAPNGFLEAETVWRHLVEALAGVPGGECDPEALLAWALDGEPETTLAALPDNVRAGLADGVEATGGRTSRVLFEAAARIGRRTVAAGLAAGVLFDAEGGERAAKAHGKLEAMLGLSDLDAPLARRWTVAAERVMRRRRTQSAAAGAPPAAAIDAVLADADALLRELGAADLARRSGMLRASLDQRLALLAQQLAAFADGAAEEIPDALRRAAGDVLDHWLAADDARRATGVEMALRLAGWLATHRGRKAPRRTFAAAARAYSTEGAFVDRARARLWDGDSAPQLADAYARLAARADAARHAENQAFGALLAAWRGPAPHDRSVLGVEAVLDRWVAPLAGAHPVLVLIVDAMSVAVFRELEDDFTRRGWVELVADDAPAPPAVIAALPTVTEVSRASLLCGAVTSGNAAAEKEGFAAHAGLRAAGRPTAPPVLFHKGDLREAGAAGVASGVAAAIGDLRRRVVGVVINAVDDHLAKGDQVRFPWTAAYVRPVEELLDLCRAAGRAVVLLSDHGHVVERDTQLRAGDGPERWRAAEGAPAPDEVELRGPRVVAAGRRLLAPWSERVRFGMKKNGYHGGAALQEVVLPFGVFAPADVAPQVAGWREADPAIPDWWRSGVESVPPAAPTPAPEPAPRPPRAGETGYLFAPRAAPAGRPATWLDRLVATDLFKAQRRQAARTALSDERIRAILTALDARGGTLTRTALAAALGVPAFRLDGILSALRRILNVDGYDVLTIDDASESVTLNRELLLVQFDLTPAGT